MKIVFRLLIGLVLALAALMTLQIIASESGEVVLVSSRDADGAMQETRLWVVEYEGASYLRSGSPMAGWYQRMQANPDVEVTRDERTFLAQARPDVSLREPINALMREKYGWADQFIALMFGRDDAIPIRLTLTDQS